MSSRRKASTKSRHDHSVPDSSSSQHNDVAPKVEFAAHSVDPEEVDAYWAAIGEVKPPRPGTWAPPPFRANHVDGCPSKSCPNGLAAIRSFCRVPGLVEFRLPEAGEVVAFRPIQVVDRLDQPVRFAAHRRDFGVELRTGILRMKSLGERSQLNYGAPRRRIKQSSYVTVMPFTNQEIFSSREFSPPEKLEMANLLSDEPTTNSIMPKMIIHVKMFEADQRRLFSQFEVREFCENLVEGVVKALKDVSKIQKKSTTTRAPVAKPSLFINEKPKGKSENNLEDLKDFSDFLPIFDKYGEELMEILIICEDNCDLPFPEPDFMFDKEHTIAELTFLQPEHPSSLVLFSQDFEEKPFDYPHQGLLLGTRRTMDVDLYPIFDEEDDNLDELTPIVDEEAPNITSINMENHICFDPDTTFTPLSTDIQEHCEKLDLINSLPKMFVKINSQDVKSFGFDKSSSKKNQFKQSSYVTVMPFTNQEIFSSREFRPPEKLEMANLLSDEPTTNSIMPKTCLGQMEKPIKYWLREKMDFDQASKGHILAHIRSIFITFQSHGLRYIKRQSKFQSRTLFSQVFVFIFNVLFLAHSSLDFYNL
uniref:Uncharacterized protein n=1 Tax=Brassica oleracea var. oleracea TaxID=109376 RepID=A0A0D3ASG2_BRAOL